jgi:hypothetical protein
MDHVFHDDQPDEVPEAVRELMERGGDELVEDLLQIGVHVNTRLVATNVHTGEDDPVQAGLLLAGWVADIAFSDRVLRPEVDRDEDILAQIDEATVAADYNALREELLGDA